MKSQHFGGERVWAGGAAVCSLLCECEVSLSYLTSSENEINLPRLSDFLKPQELLWMPGAAVLFPKLLGTRLMWLCWEPLPLVFSFALVLASRALKLFEHFRRTIWGH